MEKCGLRIHERFSKGTGNRIKGERELVRVITNGEQGRWMSYKLPIG